MEIIFSFPLISRVVKSKIYPLTKFTFPFSKKPVLISGPLVSNRVAIC